MNNDSKAELAAFEAVNIDFLLETVEQARRALVKLFVNVSSVHALDESNGSFYARSKRAAVERLGKVEGISVTTLYLPLVYGAAWPRSLAALNHLPGPLARIVFAFLASLKPTLNVSRLAAFMADRSSHEDAVILSDGQSRNFAFHVAKRTIDISSSLLVLLLFWWGMILIWLAVKLSSPGSGIFPQERIGRNGRLFTCYKFRTMVSGAPNVATHEAPASLITAVGKFLRRTKLDELPQIFNVLLNDMSLVGPRPSLPTQTELIEARKNKKALELKPGITGFAQINNVDMSDPVRLACWDAQYRDLQCLTLDVRILLATLLGRGRGDPIEAQVG